MTYEKPDVVLLANAMNAIQSPKNEPGRDPIHDGSVAYEDWED